MTAPLGSETMPEMEPVNVWPRSSGRNPNRPPTNKTTRDISNLPLVLPGIIHPRGSDVAHALACRAETRLGARARGMGGTQAPARVPARHAEACATSSARSLGELNKKTEVRSQEAKGKASRLKRFESSRSGCC